jgi:FixJ family two-component response regulator
MSEPDAMVFVVDHEARTRESLKNLIRSVGSAIQVMLARAHLPRNT